MSAQPPSPQGSLTGLDPDKIERLNNYALLCCQSLGLSEGQIEDLLILVRVSSADPFISYGQQYWNIFQAANSMASKNYQQQAVIDIAAMNKFIQRALERIKSTYELNRDQLTIIIARSKQVVGEAGRTRYKNAGLEAEARLHGLEDFKHVWGEIVSEAVVCGACKDKTKNATGTYRIDLYKTLVGKDMCSLTIATVMLVTRYCSLPANKKIELKYQVHVALLRRFILEEQWGDWVTELIKEDGSKELVKRTASAGKVPKGEDFWSRADKWFSDLMEKFGEGFAGEKWEQYITETVRLDHKKYHAEKHSAVEDLPEEYYQQVQPQAVIPPAAAPIQAMVATQGVVLQGQGQPAMTQPQGGSILAGMF